MRHATRIALLTAWVASVAGQQCKGTLYLTLDTGSMKPAAEIAAVLRKHQVKATFFLSNEKTLRGDNALDDGWKAHYLELIRDGHVFGSHTWRHHYLRSDVGPDKVAYVGPGGQREALAAADLCKEIRRPADRFRELTGQTMLPLWRAPGGRHTARALEFARSCGFQHVGWTPAGFLGDELPSAAYPNQVLLARAVKNLRDGDVLMMHTGIRSRKDPFWVMLDPLLAQLKAKGFCFATVPAAGLPHVVNAPARQ